jgi:hypothetical protein
MKKRSAIKKIGIIGLVMIITTMVFSSVIAMKPCNDGPFPWVQQGYTAGTIQSITTRPGYFGDIVTSFTINDMTINLDWSQQHEGNIVQYLIKEACTKGIKIGVYYALNGNMLLDLVFPNFILYAPWEIPA